ncbi:MAG TPA: hypothetical protein VGO11_22585 [Chthoniobacteraceae bacterium]|nr:hypothetical protein [Chthoniobacteraceae bacterium]
MPPPIDELRVTLEKQPASLRVDQLMDEVFRDASAAVGVEKRDVLEKLAEQAGGLARELFAQTASTMENWRLWYAGQLQGIAGLLRVALRQQQIELPTAALLKGQKNALPLLQILATGESNLTDLAARAGIDGTQIGREIKKLAQHYLVDTAKEGRERWARISTLGKMALEDLAAKGEDQQPKPSHVRKPATGGLRTFSCAATTDRDILTQTQRMAAIMGRRQLALAGR